MRTSLARPPQATTTMALRTRLVVLTTLLPAAILQSAEGCIPDEAAAGRASLAGTWRSSRVPSGTKDNTTCPLLQQSAGHRVLRGAQGWMEFVAHGCATTSVGGLEPLLSTLHGRTVVMVGDSLSMAQLYSLACSVGGTSILIKAWGTGGPRGDALILRPHEALFAFISLRGSSSRHDGANRTPQAVVRALHDYAGLASTDVVLVNFGVSYSPMITRSGQGQFMKSAIQFIQEWQRLFGSPRDPSLPLLAFRETAPQGWTPHGLYPGVRKAHSSGNCSFFIGSNKAAVGEVCGIAPHNPYNCGLTPLLRTHHVPVLPVWAATATAAQQFSNPPRDCTHFLNPGPVYQFWNVLLLRMVRALRGGAALQSHLHTNNTREVALLRAFVALQARDKPGLRLLRMNTEMQLEAEVKPTDPDVLQLLSRRASGPRTTAVAAAATRAVV